MSFIDQEITIVFTPKLLEELGKLIENYGTTMDDGAKEVFTLMAHWDDVEKTRKRAAKFPESVSPTPLKDGRLAVTGLWSEKAIDLLSNKGLEGAEIITKEDLEKLIFYTE
jgi:hypothetical protein